ncbi:flagellar biosynthesis anti-sigma factor FlgM [Ornithinibacillus sp. 179-J 7C1 HS]|uniref:flagellar biosynthesis anti-sigma factor FlgM n=1 Tax=Ornithinibacillus sp. 179-J 7C1 HS TaxID=3142384 RepID=UPI0039A2626A
MKINGPNQTNFNPYKNQIQKQMDLKKAVKQQDQLQISSQAMQLQENTKVNAQRDAYVQEIKNRVESGEYEINHDIVAKKMINFWSNQ